MKKFGFTLAEGTTHVATQNSLRKAAFTLAEVLITLGIIGVVAALTLPTLIANYQKQVLVTQLKKSVNILENMARKMVADDGVSNFNQTEFFQKFDCYGDSAQSVCQDSIAMMKKYLNIVSEGYGTAWLQESGEHNHIVLADGITVYLGGGPGCIYQGDYIDMKLDVNGQRGPNELGRDMYYVYFDKNGKIAGATNSYYGYCESKTDDQLKVSYGNGYDVNCYFTIVQRNGWKMNY